MFCLFSSVLSNFLILHSTKETCAKEIINHVLSTLEYNNHCLGFYGFYSN